MNNRLPIWEKIPSHITPKSSDEMKAIRSQVPQFSMPDGSEKTIKTGIVAGVGERFKTSSFGNYLMPTQSQMDAVNCVQNWAQKVQDGLDTNLVLAGNHGTGKTHLATAVLRLLSLTGINSEIITFRDMMLEIRSTYQSSTKQSELMILQRLSSCDVLALDDIGKQRNSQSEQLSLYSLLDKRYSNKKPTILITMLPGKAFCELLGEAALDRIRQGHLVWVECSWNSFRILGDE
ncbi:ATP-binding protein [Vibrio viridaestus]|uniref:AAA family ATPase n=1 Tax=Vibrio viridaestus TaxID=2487322 RepID=A0A3N9TB51_9VIBR|nr:ATP-binding protein [Vibrio viridaestus]RQW61170.1 AAA family ATPase [Vibrio viridaestus]